MSRWPRPGAIAAVRPTTSSAPDSTDWRPDLPPGLRRGWAGGDGAGPTVAAVRRCSASEFMPRRSWSFPQGPRVAMEQLCG